MTDLCSAEGSGLLPAGLLDLSKRDCWCFAGRLPGFMLHTHRQTLPSSRSARNWWIPVSKRWDCAQWRTSQTCTSYVPLALMLAGHFGWHWFSMVFRFVSHFPFVAWWWIALNFAGIRGGWMVGFAFSNWKKCLLLWENPDLERLMGEAYVKWSVDPLRQQ